MRFLSCACVVFGLLATSVSAEIYKCKLAPQSQLKHNVAAPTDVTIELTRGRVTITDSFIRAVGYPSVEGKLDRKVGKQQLFGWQVNGIPLRLMPEEVTWYRQTVNYRARLNLSSLEMTVRGDFVSRYGGGNTGTDIRARGRCRRG